MCEECEVEEQPELDFSDWTFELAGLSGELFQDLARKFAVPMAKTLIEEFKKELGFVLIDAVGSEPVARFSVEWAGYDLIDIAEVRILEQLEGAVAQGCINREKCPNLAERLRVLVDKIESQEIDEGE
jgi:hypothetical protein